MGTILGCPGWVPGSTIWTGAHTDWRIGNPHYGYNFNWLGRNWASGSGYFYNFHRITQVEKPTETIAFTESIMGFRIIPHWETRYYPNFRHNKMTNVLWLDGHVESLKDVELLKHPKEVFNASATAAKNYYWFLKKSQPSFGINN